ncbi:MAG: threonylcarbamoyl-AMP synthase [Tannerella sp.]|jgi:tRNA threonylcarbamoyl adenosine modification protein (Sua5/YciO/YrdC/YwlC family)|nr:threonylcarbamoyl-AMP synthase [Tannerella sp.]
MLIRIYPENPNAKEINRVVKTLADGGLVIYPTDTLYAVGCDALNVHAVEKICRMRGVDPQKCRLSVICADLSDISGYVRVNNAAFRLMKRLLPGPYTFILPAVNGSRLPRPFKRRSEIGIRIPADPIACELTRSLGNPLLSMSVRLDDGESEYATDPELIHERYGSRVDIVVDGGFGGTEGSTVVDCLGDEITLVRQGKGAWPVSF